MSAASRTGSRPAKKSAELTLIGTSGWISERVSPMLSKTVGIETTIPLHQRLVDDPQFRRGAYDIHWLERFLGQRE